MECKDIIVLVDDEEPILKSLYRELRQSNRQISYFTDTELALNYIYGNSIDLIISDYRMSKINGVEFLSRAKKVRPEALSIILSGNSDLDFLKDAINEAGIYRFITKPWESFDLKTVVKYAIEFKKMQTENTRLANELRRKNDHIRKQKDELERLEALQPGITQISWDDDGAIIINEDEI